jgi:hypothetical protein
MSNVHIDVHHHLLTPEYIEEMAKVGVVEAGGVAFPHWKPEDSLAVMDRAETQMALLSLSSPGLCFGDATKERKVARVMNEFAAQTMTRWPNRFGFFATLPLPDVKETYATVKGLATLPGLSEQDRQDIYGNNALKLFPRLQAQK